MQIKPTYIIRFKCHNGACHYKPVTFVKIAMADDTTHGIDCAHCQKRFYVEHTTAEHGYGWLHSGSHSRIVHYKPVRSKLKDVEDFLKDRLTLRRASLARA